MIELIRDRYDKYPFQKRDKYEDRCWEQSDKCVIVTKMWQIWRPLLRETGSYIVTNLSVKIEKWDQKSNTFICDKYDKCPFQKTRQIWGPLSRPTGRK